jgi:anti-sigma regulatory factor (Ser/Thr protein kinase)
MVQVTHCNSTRRFKFDHILCVPSTLKEVPRVRDFVSDLLSVAGFGGKVTMNVSLALEEAMSNAIEHGNLAGQPSVEVGVSISAKVCILQIRDFGGQTFNPDYFEKISEVKTWGYGGRGIFLIKKLMDEVYYFFQPGESTTLVMLKYRDEKPR